MRVEQQTVAEIGAGLLVLLAVGRDDGPSQAQDLAKRIVQLRVFPDDTGKMNRSLIQTEGSLALVSQFTLYGDATKGRRPYFGAAAPPSVAEPLVEAVAAAARGFGVEVVTGRFQAHMEVALVNQGPVTILLESNKNF